MTLILYKIILFGTFSFLCIPFIYFSAVSKFFNITLQIFLCSRILVSLSAIDEGLPITLLVGTAIPNKAQISSELSFSPYNIAWKWNNTHPPTYIHNELIPYILNFDLNVMEITMHKEGKNYVREHEPQFECLEKYSIRANQQTCSRSYLRFRRSI